MFLACYPFEGQDPFIIKEMPDVFFVSNQQSFQTSLKTNDSGNYTNLNLISNELIYKYLINYILKFIISGKTTRLISVPSFSSTQTCILLNLNNLECHPVSFKTFDP